MSEGMRASKLDTRVKRCLVCGKRFPAHSGEDLCSEHLFTLGEIWQLDTKNWTWRKIERKGKTKRVEKTL